MTDRCNCARCLGAHDLQAAEADLTGFRKGAPGTHRGTAKCI
jgi:hypothetical protein